MTISEDLEISEPGDLGYLDRIATLLESCGPVAAHEVRACVRNLLSDIYELSNAEEKRIKKLAAGAPFNAEPLRDVPDDEATRTDAIIEILRACQQHQALVESA